MNALRTTVTVCVATVVAASWRSKCGHVLKAQQITTVDQCYSSQVVISSKDMYKGPKGLDDVGSNMNG
jgi:hypothetical protein